MGPRAGLDTEARGKILCLCRGSNLVLPGRPARSQTLYFLSYPAPRHNPKNTKKGTRNERLQLKFYKVTATPAVLNGRDAGH
jgi:hypothetical protein